MTQITCKTSPAKTAFRFVRNDDGVTCLPVPGETQFTAFELYRKIAVSSVGKQGAIGYFLFARDTTKCVRRPNNL
jgi:hypothetical protein